MLMLNRSVLIVRAKQPFADWVNEVSILREPLDIGNRDLCMSAYLVTGRDMDDESDDEIVEEEDEAVIQRNWKRIFEHELNEWDGNPGDWPRRKTYVMFRKWFDIELIGTVLEEGDEEIKLFEMDV